MSIQTQIERLTGAKAALKTAIEQKGVAVPEGAPLEQYAPLVEQIAGGKITPTLLATLNGDGESIELTADVELTDGLYAFGAVIPANTPDENKGQNIYGKIGDVGIYTKGIRTAGLISNSAVTQAMCVYTVFIKDSKMYVCGTANTSGNNNNASFKEKGEEIVKHKIALYSQSSKPVPVGVYAMLWRLG